MRALRLGLLVALLLHVASARATLTPQCKSSVTGNLGPCTSLTAHAPLVGNGTAAPTAVSAGTAGQVWTSAGASADPVMADPITATSGSTTLGSTYTVSADNGSYESTGLSVTLPSAGTYLVWYQARTNCTAVTTAGAYLLTEMYNVTDGAAVANSEQIGAYCGQTAVSNYGRGFVLMIVTVAGSKSLALYVKVVAPSSTSTRTVNSDANGRSRMGYVKISS